MRKKLTVLVLTCLLFSIVSGNTNKNEGNSINTVGNNYKCEPETTTTEKLPLFIRIFGKKPLTFIKKSISKIIGKNLTAKLSLRRNRLASKDEKIPENENVSPNLTVFSTEKEKNVAFEEKSIDLNNANTKRQPHKSGTWNAKPTFLNPMEYYRKFVYKKDNYSTSVKIRKYYTPEGISTLQRTINQQTPGKVSRSSQRANFKNDEVSTSTLKVSSNTTNDIHIFTTKIPVGRTSYENPFREQIASQSDQNSQGKKRQRRCSVSSDLEEGYTYLLRKKRSESTFNPLAYLTRLSKKPIFTGDYSPRRYNFFTQQSSSGRNQNIRTDLTTSTPRTRSTANIKFAITTTTKNFEKPTPKLATTPKTAFKAVTKYWSTKYHTTPKITTKDSATKEETTSARNLTTPSTPRKHYWINNWNLPYLSYYMAPINHTYRTYEPPITTYNLNSPSKTTRAMYHLTQYWNKKYFSYYTNFDPSDESFHEFAKRLGYFPASTTRFPKIRMMPKRFRPQGFIDIFSMDSYLRNINERLERNESFAPPHERDSISSSSEDVSYWFFFNRSVTPVQLIPGTKWKMGPRPTMKPVPSYFFKDSILTRYYPPSNEEELEKVQADFKNFKRIHFTVKPTRLFTFHTFRTSSPAVRTSATPYSMRFINIKTPIPTLPTIKEITDRNIDPYGLLSKIIQYNVKIKKPLSRNGTKDVQAHLSKDHPINHLPRILQLPFTLSPKLMMYSDYRGKQLFTLLGKYHVHENNKTLERVQNPSEFLNPFIVVAPPPESGYYRIIERHRIRNNDVIEKNPVLRGVQTKDVGQKLLQTDRTVAVEIRFYPIHSTLKIKTWDEYFEAQKNQTSSPNLPTPSTPLKIDNNPAIWLST